MGGYGWGWSPGVNQEEVPEQKPTKRKRGDVIQMGGGGAGGRGRAGGGQTSQRAAAVLHREPQRAELGDSSGKAAHNTFLEGGWVSAVFWGRD